MSLSNAEIAEHFQELADLLEFTGTNPFRIRAYRNGVRILRDYPDTIAELAVDQDFDLKSIDGIGDAVAKKIVTLVETGELPQLEELKSSIPESVLDLLRIPGLGPKKAAVLYNDLEIDSLTALEEACKAQRVRELKGFGAKTEAAILDGIEIAAAANQRIYWAEADSIVTELRQHFADGPELEQFEFAGSYRRGKETVGDLDILVVADDASPVMDHLAKFPSMKTTIARGDTKMSIRLKGEFQIDLRVVPAQSFGAAWMYFTGSKEHNVALRSRAKTRGLRLNEWGIYRVEDENETWIAGETETDVYQALDLPWIAPELREDRGELQSASSESAAPLIALEDIRGDLHMHTTATDGKATLEEMVRGARDAGLSYIAITDHSKRVSMAMGLDEERLLAQWEEIDEFNRTIDDDFIVLKGIECDILEAGGMDLSDDVLSQADWVLASVHYGQQQSREQITSRILGAVENPHVDAIAHPTGRLLLKREAYQVDLSQVISACAEHKTALEVNANPARLDLNDVHVRQAADAGIDIVINSDAHSVKGLSVMRYGILQARRGGIRPAQVLNTLSSKDLLERLNSN